MTSWVYADTLEAHDLALRQAINALENHHFKLNKTKCIFGATSVDFLGHRLSAAGIEILPERVASLTQTPQPSSLKEIQAFLGAVNYLAQFLPRLASLVEPLRCRSRKNQDFIWTPEQTCAFNKVKAAIKSHLPLHSPFSTLAPAPLSLLMLATPASALSCLKYRTANAFQCNSLPIP